MIQNKPEINLQTSWIWLLYYPVWTYLASNNVISHMPHFLFDIPNIQTFISKNILSFFENFGVFWQQNHQFLKHPKKSGGHDRSHHLIHENSTQGYFKAKTSWFFNFRSFLNHYGTVCSSCMSQFENPFHVKNQNLCMSSVFNVEHCGKVEICISSFITEKIQNLVKV